MFAAICDFVKQTTNGGVIKPSLAVFRPRQYGKHDFRVWNKFMISYAGYSEEVEVPNPRGPGEIRKMVRIGDQGNLEFTRVICFTALLVSVHFLPFNTCTHQVFHKRFQMKQI